MTRDGVTLIAMGFTGAKALQFKLAYIAEFNRMEVEMPDIERTRFVGWPLWAGSRPAGFGTRRVKAEIQVLRR